MTWTFHIVSIEGHRLFSRILQVLEGQRVRVCAFSGEADNSGIRVTATVMSEEDKAYRIEALLYRLEDVRSVSVLANHKNSSREACNPATSGDR